MTLSIGIRLPDLYIPCPNCGGSVAINRKGQSYCESCDARWGLDGSLIKSPEWKGRRILKRRQYNRKNGR